MDDAFETALASGDPASLAAMKEARALRAEYGRRFEGTEQADKFVAGLIDGTKTPEELLNFALGASQVSKPAAARFIERLRLAANNDDAVMGPLRAAHFNRMTRDATGNPLKPGQIVRNIRSSEFNGASAVRALYEPAEWAEIRRLAAALEPLTAKGDFAKSSGTAERLMRSMLGRLSGGWVGTAMEVLAGGRAATKARQAIEAPVRARAVAPVSVAPGLAQMTDELIRD